MKKVKVFFVILGTLMLLISVGYGFFSLLFPDNARVKRFGGTAELDLPANTKLINVTWKDDELWTLTREMKPNESPETYKFTEDSKWGILEGTYVIKETR